MNLEPLEKPILPPAERGLSPRTKVAWNAWRADPVTQMYGPADLVAIKMLAVLMDSPRTAPAELRLRMDGLGLTPKGRRDLRWRLPVEESVGVEESLAPIRRLMISAPEWEPPVTALSVAGFAPDGP